MFAQLFQQSNVIDYKYWELNTTKLCFARDFFYNILVQRNELQDENDEFVHIFNDINESNHHYTQLEFSESDLKQIIFSLGSDYDQENLDSYIFIVESELINDNYEYFIKLIN